MVTGSVHFLYREMFCSKILRRQYDSQDFMSTLRVKLK